jgi:hypothetical protein
MAAAIAVSAAFPGALCFPAVGNRERPLCSRKSQDWAVYKCAGARERPPLPSPWGAGGIRDSGFRLRTSEEGIEAESCHAHARAPSRPRWVGDIRIRPPHVSSQSRCYAESGEAVHKLCTDGGGLSVGSEAHALRAVSSGSAWCGRSPANPPQPLGNMSIERAIALSILSSKVRRGCALFLVGEAASRRVGKSMSWILTLPGSM